ncbi:MAG: MFS transporter [Saccharofermentanales bacterium]
MSDFSFKKLNPMRNVEPSRRNMVFFIIEGIFGAMLINLANPLFSMFAKRLGADDFQIGLISSMPALAGILALIPGALFLERQKDKKNSLRFLILLLGMLYPIAAISSYLGKYQVAFFIFIIVLMNWPFSIFCIEWQSFFTDVLDSRDRSIAYSKRSAVSTFFGVVTALAAGIILTYVPTNDSQRIMIYQLFFIISFGFALLERYFIGRIKDYPIHTIVNRIKPLVLCKTCVLNLLKDKEFRGFTILAFLFHVSWQMAWPLFFLYQVNVLHADEAWLSYITVTFGIASVVTFPFWGKVIQKKGAKLVIVMGTFGLALNALALPFIKSLPVLLIVNTLVGLTFGAYTIGLFENLMHVLPKGNKTLNIAIYTTIINISGLISPLVGVAIYKITSLSFTLILSGIFRLVVTVLFILRYIHSKKQARVEQK